MKDRVIYTAIFGDKDVLNDPEVSLSGFDLICFTDNPNLRSERWKIVVVDRPFEDPVRCARYYKVLTHKFLSEYEYSVWVDGNMVIKKDPTKMLSRYLKDVNLAVYKHGNLKRRIFGLFWVRDWTFARNCIYKEAEALLERNRKGQYMDDPALIQNQISKYRNQGYPENNGLAVTMILLRKHNSRDVISCMESWWHEIKENSRRDQLSFNYVAWKNNFKFKYIDGDPRYNKYFSKVGHKLKQNFKA